MLSDRPIDAEGVFPVTLTASAVLVLLIKGAAEIVSMFKIRTAI
jgi:hypothetical protein